MGENVSRRRAIGAVAALGLVGIAGTGTAMAADQDLSSMSLDDLVALRAQVEKAIAEKLSSDGTSMPAGEYAVGKDILPGTYSFMPIFENGERGESDVAQIVVLDGNTTTHNFRFSSSNPEDTYTTFTIDDGNSLSLYGKAFDVVPQVLPYAVSQDSDK